VIELPRGWEWATVGDLAELADGPFGSNLKTAHYVEKGPRVVRLQNIGDGVFRDEHAHITQQHYEQLVKHAAQPGDVVVASLGDEAPRACLVPAWLGPAIVKADCIRARPLGAVEPAYLMWMLNSPPVRQQAAASIKGIGRPRLGLGGIRRLRMPLPPLAEQRRIVTAIEEVFSRVVHGTALLDTAKSRNRRMKLLILNAVLARFRETVPLKEVADVRLGRQRSPKNHVGPTMRPYLRAANVTWDGLRLDDVKEMNFTPVEAATYELRLGDVLLSEASGSAREVGKPAVWRDEIPGCCFQNTLIRVRSHGPLPEYLRLVFLRAALLGQFAQAAPGVGIHHLGSTRLAQWPIPLCSVEEQLTVVEAADQQFSLADAVEERLDATSRRAKSLRRSLLSRAFRGELVPQDPGEERAGGVLERIAAERAATSKKIQERKEKTSA
jgi:type I restriction enzyme S subunit